MHRAPSQLGALHMIASVRSEYCSLFLTSQRRMWTLPLPQCRDSLTCCRNASSRLAKRKEHAGFSFKAENSSQHNLFKSFYTHPKAQYRVRVFNTNLVLIFNASGIGLGQAEYLPARDVYAGYSLPNSVFYVWYRD